MKLLIRSQGVDKATLCVRLVAVLVPLVLLNTGSAGAATNVVKLVNFQFQPQFLTNHPGDTVIWTNTTLTGHNVVSSNSVWAAPALFTSPGTFHVTFTNTGTYGYFCSPHRSFGMTGIIFVQSADQAPTVAMSSPASGATLAAPATITLRADANDSDGTIAKVEFFSGATPLGTVTTSPYSLTVPNLPAGTYDFSAQAQDNSGLSATSAVVTVSVVTPGPILFRSDLAPVSGQLPLSLSVTPGLSYEVSSTIDLTIWSVLTNFVATQPVMNFSVPTSGLAQGFFRARLLPNP